MNIINKIIDMDGMYRLRYGFFMLFGIHETNIEAIVTYLKVIWNYSDQDIIDLVYTVYSQDKDGSIVILS